jgi:hypothetical protein
MEVEGQKSTGGRKRSLTRSNFEDVNPKQVKCNHCHQIFCVNTETMKNHLLQCHGEAPFTPPKKETKRVHTTSNQVPSDSHPHWTKEMNENAQILLAKFIFDVGSIPFSLVDNEEFRKFLSFVAPQFVPPNEQKVANTLLENV